MARVFKRNQAAKAIEEPMINITPLIDVVFVILIMFILVAPLLEIDRVDLADAPEERASGATIAVQESSPIAIHVHKDNSVWFNGKKVKTDQLVALLKQAKKKYPRVRPQLFHDKKGAFGTYQSVKNAVEEAGFEHLDIVLKPS